MSHLVSADTVSPPFLLADKQLSMFEMMTHERFDFDPAVMGFQARGRRILPGAIVPTDGGAFDVGAPDGGALDGGGAVGSSTDGGVMGRPSKLAGGCN